MNIRLLTIKLLAENISNSTLAEKLGIGRSTLYRKLSGQTEFTRSEIAAMKEVLSLDDDLLVEIFFGKKCV